MKMNKSKVKITKKQLESNLNDNVDRVRIEKARKEMEDEKEMKRSKKEIERKEMLLLMKENEDKTVNKKKRREQELQIDKENSKKYRQILQKQDDERDKYHNNIKNLSLIQDIRLKNTEEYLKIHHKPSQNTTSNNPTTNIPLTNSSPKRRNTLLNEILNSNLDQVNKRKQLEQVTQKILLSQLEHKKNMEKETLLAKAMEKELLQKEGQEQKERAETNVKLNRDKKASYMKALDNQRLIHNTLPNSDPSIDQVRNHIKSKLGRVGLSSLIKLDALLRLTDIVSSSRISFIDFSKVLRDFGVVNSLSTKEDDLLYKLHLHFCDETNSVNYSKFIKLIKGEIGDSRYIKTRKLYFHLTENIVDKYFKAKEFTYEVLKRLLTDSEKIDSWENYLIMTTRKENNHAYIITINDFVDYHTYISPLIESEKEFDEYLSKSYKQFENDYSKSSIILPVLEREEKKEEEREESFIILDNIYKRIGQRLFEKEKSVGIVNIKNIFEKLKGRSKEDNLIEDLLKELNINLDQKEISSVSNQVNRSSNSLPKRISFLIESILKYDNLTKSRQDSIHLLFKALAVNSKVQLGIFKSLFKPSLHPRVLTGEYKSNDAYQEFLLVFNFHFPAYDSNKIIHISKEVFNILMSHYSFTLSDSDEDFSYFCFNCFKNIKK